MQSYYHNRREININIKSLSINIEKLLYEKNFLEKLKVKYYFSNHNYIKDQIHINNLRLSEITKELEQNQKTLEELKIKFNKTYSEKK